MNAAETKSPNQSIFFSQHPLFETLTFDEKCFLKEVSKLKILDGKSLIYKPDEPISEIYLIQKGKIKTEIIHPDGKVFIKRIGLPGDFFGEHKIYNIDKRNEFAWTLQEDAEIYSIPVSDFKKLMSLNFDFMVQFFKIIGNQIKKSEYRILSFTAQQARWRVIDFLKEMVKTQGQKIGFEWLIRHHMTQEEIGSYTGTGRQAVTETFSQFKAENIIHYSRGRVLIRDLTKLK